MSERASRNARRSHRAAAGSAAATGKASRSYDEVTSNSDGPEEVTAEVAGALRGNTAGQSRQEQVVQQTPLGQKPEAAHVPLGKSNHARGHVKQSQKQAGNEGRVLVSQETLLRWLKFKAA